MFGFTNKKSSEGGKASELCVSRGGRDVIIKYATIKTWIIKFCLFAPWPTGIGFIF